MAVAPVPYRLTLDEFVRAWEAGAFERRVELIEGDIWAVPIGDWHGDTTGLVIRALPNERFRVTASSLATGGSLPDPDCWVRSATAQPVARLSDRLSTWSPADVLLVVEVGDETLEADLGVKAGLYGRAGYQCYWVVSRDGVYEHTCPSATGYDQRRLYRPGEMVPVRHAGTELAVAALLQTG